MSNEKEDLLEKMKASMELIKIHLVSHPFTQANKDLEFHIKYALGQLSDAYSIAEKIDHEDK